MIEEIDRVRNEIFSHILKKNMIDQKSVIRMFTTFAVVKTNSMLVSYLFLHAPRSDVFVLKVSGRC